jgi:adenylate kinase
LEDVDTDDGAAPIDIHRLAEAWESSSSGRWVVDGHLSHLLDVDGLVLPRCRPSALAQRLEARGYKPGKVRANVEWEMTAGHWAELLEFEVELPLLELDAGRHSSEELAARVEAWCAEGLPTKPMQELADEAVDWLGETQD